MKKTKTVLSLIICLLIVLALSLPAAAHVADLSAFAGDLYEVESSVVLPATIAWASDSTALSTAVAERRPNTVFVRIDENLAVKSMGGFLISDSLFNYMKLTKGKSLPAVYVEDEATADALVRFVQKTNAGDFFVVASAANAQYVEKVVDASTAVIGIVDFCDSDLSKADLAQIIDETHAANARIALIPEAIASRESIDYLRGRLTTVWVQCAANEKSVYTQLTNGANGVYCEDFELVIKALESFSETRTLLRPSFIAGHRGMPSHFIENTINSAVGALEAGADVIECDIYLSRDGEIFLLHDTSLKRLFNRPDITDASELTLAELQEFEYDMTDLPKDEAPNSVLNSNNENRTKEGRENLVIAYDPLTDKIPSARDYFKALEDDDLIHFVELKTKNPEIVPALKELAEELDITDQIVCISFNAGIYGDDKLYDEKIDVLGRMKQDWPTMPQGYLGADGSVFSLHDEMIEAEGNSGGAVRELLAALQPHNATYNPYFGAMSYRTVADGRHRGITVWPWTYNKEVDFANAYLSGIYGITTNYAFWASDYPKQIVASDLKTENGGKLDFSVLSQRGEILNRQLELVQISGIPVSMDKDGTITSEETGTALVMLRLVEKLDVGGADLSEIGDTTYALYSNPVTIEIIEPEA